MRVLIAVTHLLGTGHLSRARTLGQAFVEQGNDVLLISGGMPAPQLDMSGLSLLGLPPLRSDGTDFTRLLDECGVVADQAYMSARISALTQAVRDFRPHVLITELYPFGRRVLAVEFQAALEEAHRFTEKPLVLSSIRDVLAPPSKPSKVADADALIKRYYDGVLVHSDPEITPLDLSWPVSDLLSAKLHYTGFVAPAALQPHPDRLGENEILVSAGGGSVGQPIFHAAIEAARKMPNRRWRLLVGGRDARARIASLSDLVGDAPVTIEPVRPDFRQMLPLAAASVSMCGYNTVMDLLQSGTPAVFSPFDDGKEVEQSLRAQSLSNLTGIEVVPSAAMSGSNLADAVARVISAGPRPLDTHGFDGARQAVRIATDLYEARK